MKNFALVAMVILGIAIAGCGPTKVDTRDYVYEAYCDSIYAADPNYYLDVLCETDEYCTYIEINGPWWED